MVEVFTSVKPMVGRAGEIQRAALENWRQRIGCVPNVFDGDPPEFSQIARMAVAGKTATTCLYANADILFGEGVTDVISWCERQNEDFLVIGRRTDDLPDGRRLLHRPSGMDYFFFRPGMYCDLPKTIVGRAYYDCALLAYCFRRGIRVVDASDVLVVIHQWHDYDHVSGGRSEVFSGADAVSNKRNNDLKDFGPHIADVQLKFERGHSGLTIVRKRVPILRRIGFWGVWNILTRGGMLA